VVNVVNYDMVQQISLASTEYADGVDEFVKSGLTPVASEVVKPFRVKNHSNLNAKSLRLFR
jgi:flavin reductase (DIM6/NTAB) family NADH-FMN oxidoreductase RutF